MSVWGSVRIVRATAWALSFAALLQGQAVFVGPAVAAELVDFASVALATSSAEQPERSPREAIDGDEKTRWAGDNAQPGHWLQLELSEPRPVSACRLVWEFPDRTYLYKLEGSTDGVIQCDHGCNAEVSQR